MELAGKVIVVTGASRGLGAALVELALAGGASVGACSRSQGPVSPAERALSQALDVTDGPAVEAFAQAVAERFGRIDLWVNNAGLLAPIGKLADVDAGAYQALIDANVMGVFHGSAAYARIARRQGGGTLINISSGAARNAYRGWSAYCASKAAVDRMSECLALEEAGGLRVHSLAPGIIETDMQGLIRAQDERDFPDVDRFRSLHAEGALLDPAEGARRILDFSLSQGGASQDVCVDLRG